MTGAKSPGADALSMVNPGAAAIDIGSTMHMAAISPQADDNPVRAFGTFTGELHEMARWFKASGVTSVAMESTGVYWIPAYEVLEAHGFHVILVNARYAKNVPGRKTDVSDAAWLQRLHSYGLLRGSFRPEAGVATMRAYLRQRERLIEYAASHIQHMQKALMEMNVQLHHVVSDITGVTGMRIIRAIVAGERTPVTLAEMRDVRCHASVEIICAALSGNWRDEHIFALCQSLALRLLSDQNPRMRSQAGGRAQGARNRQGARYPRPPQSQDQKTAGECACLRGPVCPLSRAGRGPDANPWNRPILGAQTRRRVRHRSRGMAQFQAFYVLAMSGAGQQDIRWQTALVENAALIEPCGSTPASGRDHNRPQRHRTRRVLPEAGGARGKGEGGHGHSTQDRGPVLQQPALWHGVS